MIIKSLYYLPALMWALLIYFLSTTSTANLPTFNLLSADKIGHLVFYTGLVFWLLWAARKVGWWRREIIGASALLAACYGTVLEYVQAYLPHRSFDYADMLANFMGCLLGLVSFSMTWRLAEYFFSFFVKKN